MKLEKFNFKKSEETSIYSERHSNDSKGSFLDYSEVNPIYDPQGKIPDLNVPFAYLEKKDLIVFESNPSEELVNAIKKGMKYKFFWHPDTIRESLSIDGFHTMQPTSSTRTMFDMETKLFYAKTDLDKKHFRFIRRLKRDSVEHSILVNDDLLKMFAKSNMNFDRFGILPESLGLVIRSGKHENSGIIFRETKTYPESNGKAIVIPYHALYAQDPKSPQDSPLLIQLCLKNSPKDPLGYFIENIIGPVQDAWVLLLNERGLLPELHGQNSLIEVSDNFDVGRLIQRDFQGIYSDSDIRKANNLEPFAKHVVGQESGTTSESQYSHVFDSMIGRYLFSRLTNTFCAYFPKYSYKDVANEIKKRFLSIKDNKLEVFPNTTYRFNKSAQDQSGNDVDLKDTGLPPEFR